MRHVHAARMKNVHELARHETRTEQQESCCVVVLVHEHQRLEDVGLVGLDDLAVHDLQTSDTAIVVCNVLVSRSGCCQAALLCTHHFIQNEVRTLQVEHDLSQATVSIANGNRAYIQLALRYRVIDDDRLHKTHRDESADAQAAREAAALTTFSKYLSSVSTNVWMNSSTDNSFCITVGCNEDTAGNREKSSSTHGRLIVVDANDKEERRVAPVDALRTASEM
jgi:hypothetical protein